MFNVQCPRCGGTGRFDRGTCFQCKGARSVKRKTKPKLPAYDFTVTYPNGSINSVRMYFRNAADAEASIRHTLTIMNWDATITRTGSTLT